MENRPFTDGRVNVKSDSVVYQEKSHLLFIYYFIIIIIMRYVLDFLTFDQV